MEAYQVRVNVEIVPSTESPSHEPVTQDDGSVQFTIAASDAISIDTCERALLQTAYPTLREALATHLSHMSEKKALEHVTEGTVVTNPWPYHVDGEVGRFECVTYHIAHDGKTVYNTAREVFPGLRRWELYKTSGFKELAYVYGAIEESYRKTSELLNRIRYQPEDGTPSRTLREQAAGEGNKLMNAIDHKASQILNAHDFREDGVFEGEPTTYQGHGMVSLPEAQVAEAIAVCQAEVKADCDLNTNPVSYEAPEYTVNITIDDVGTTRQKATRTCQHPETDTGGTEPSSEPKSEQKFKATIEKRAKPKKRKYVHTTVIHVEQSERSYLITGHGITHVLSVLIAFLLNSDLLQYRLQFFTDGYTILHDAIRRGFSWYPNLAIILDWYHLKEKCKIQLS